MILVKHVTDLQKLLSKYRHSGVSIGFVPTMGALHQGHISLIKSAKKSHQLTVCSIFINPAQFNNSADFEKYPITLEKDIDLLEASACDILFLPHSNEMYPPDDIVKKYDLGFIETLLEGKFRPGHFQGVCSIVHRLLNAVQPDSLFLGQKDYQQCMVIKKLIEIMNIKTQLQICATVREPDGLAMSSRNLRLTGKERSQATGIYECLNSIKSEIKPGNLEDQKNASAAFLNQRDFKVDYIEIAGTNDLKPVEIWDGKQKITALIAAYVNDIRLIDNILLN